MTISDRPAVKRRIVEVLDHAEGLEQATVSYQHPGQATPNLAVWLGDVTGAMETSDFGGNRPGRNDNYTINCVIAVAGFADESEADQACQELLVAVTEALFTGARLGDGDDDTFNVVVYPGRIDGPTGFRSAPQQSAVSVVQMVIEVVCPIRGART